MSDWEFLYEMRESGYSPEEIADAAASGGAPWDWEYLHQQELKAQYPNADLDLIQVFENLVDVAMEYKDVTNRYLPVFGELGEIFAEITFGIKRHKPRTQGSDGRLGNDFIEIKTITPEKKKKK